MKIYVRGPAEILANTGLYVYSQRKDWTGESIIVDTGDREKLAQQVRALDYQCFIETTDLAVVWNYPVQGFIIDPRHWLTNRELPLPDGGTFLSGKRQKPTYYGGAIEKWLLYLGEDWRNFQHWDEANAWYHIIKTLTLVKDFNLRQQKGEVIELVFPKATSKMTKTDKKVKQKQLENGHTALTKKREAQTRIEHTALAAKGQCPYGDECTYLAKGIICLHTNEYRKIAKFFGTRDLVLIQEGLIGILESEAERYERAKALEDHTGMPIAEVTNIANNLFKNATTLMNIGKGVLTENGTVNILNQSINVSVAVEKLEDAGLTDEHRLGLADEIGRIIEETRRSRAGGVTVVTPEPPVSGKTR